MSTLTVGSLFSGIGGIDLGLERAGMSVKWQSEIDPYCSKVLAKHWPTVPNLGDIKQIEWSGVEPVDVIAGGYPCQPFSLAGQRQGADDPRHLWPYMLGAIRELRPRYAFLENVSGHLSMGFGRVLGDLAESGYDTEWDCIPAVAVGAPHRRDRVFIVAYPNSGELRVQPVGVNRRGGSALARFDGPQEHVPDAGSTEWRRGTLGRSSGHGEPSVDGTNGVVADTDSSRLADVQGGATLTEQRGRRTVDSGGWWDVEPDVGGIVDGFSAWLDRSGRLSQAHELVLAYGNASQGDPAEDVRAVRRSLRAEVGQRPVGGRDCLSASEVLLAYLRQLETHCGQAGQPLASQEAPQGSLRGMRRNGEPARTPLRREAQQQRAAESSNAVLALSPLLARLAGQAWAAYRRSDAAPVLNWESGVARVADGVPSRVDRLRALGNAVVPQVAEFVGRRIMALAA